MRQKSIIFTVLVLATILLVGCGEKEAEKQEVIDKPIVVTDTEEKTVVEEPKCKLTTTTTGKTTICSSGCDYTTVTSAIENGFTDMIITDCGEYEENVVFKEDGTVLDCQSATIKGANVGDGVYMPNVDNGELKNCKIDGFNFGVHLLSSNNNKLMNNDLVGNNQGMRIKLSSDNLVEGNTIKDSNDDGMTLITAAENNMIKNNEISGSLLTGITVTSNKNTLEGNTIINNGEEGIHVQAQDTVLRNNVLKDNDEQGLTCKLARTITLEGNECEGNAEGACDGCPADNCNSQSC